MVQLYLQYGFFYQMTGSFLVLPGDLTPRPSPALGQSHFNTHTCK